MMQLLCGLNKDYDHVITNLLSADVLPSVHKAYHTLQQKEFKRQRSDVVCEYCKKKGHVIGQCFHLKGFPEWWDKDWGKNPRSGFRMAASADSSAEILGKGPQEADNVDPVMASAVYNEVLKMM
ncbi:Gag polyprotein [Bienertia sinuspersici]